MISGVLVVTAGCSSDQASPTPISAAAVTAAAVDTQAPTAQTEQTEPAIDDTEAPTEVPDQGSGTADADFSTSPRVGSCAIFPSDNAWNQRVDELSLRDNSTATIELFPGNLHPDFGGGGEYGIPFTVVPADQPPVPIVFRDGGEEESDPGPYPFPLDAPIEGDGEGDAHVVVLVEGSPCRLYELANAVHEGDGWSGTYGAAFDLSSNELRPLGWTSADAAGLPILPGLVRYDEVAAGRIEHAIRVTFSQTQRGYILPATHHASDDTDPDLPPMGLRLRLSADYDLTGMTGQSLVIATALKEYGFIVADNGSDWYFTGERNEGWDDDDLAQLKDIPGTAFEVVDTGEVQV
jgi:hypothetical protein